MISEECWKLTSILACFEAAPTEVDDLWQVTAMESGMTSNTFRGDENGEEQELAKRLVTIRFARRLWDPELDPVLGES